MAISLSQLRIEATMDASGYVAGGNAIVATNQRAVASSTQLTGSLEQTDRRLTVNTSGWDRFVRTLQGVTPEQLKLEQGQRRLQGALDAGKISVDQHTQLLTLLQQRYAAIPQHLNAATVSTGQMRFAVRDLGFQINDLATQLASGGSPFRALVQQAGQIQGAFSAGGGVSATLGAFATSISSMITPTRVAITGIVALGLGIAALASRAADANQSIRVFNVLLKGMGDGALTDAASLEAAAKRLKDIGLSAAEARQQIAAVGQAGLNPAAAEQIIRTGANLSAYAGGNQTQALTQALAGGVESAVKFGLAVRGITVAEAENALEMARHGQVAQALDKIFQSISEHAKGLERDALSPAAKAIRDMKTAWSEAMDSFSKSEPVKIVVAALTELAKTIDAIARGLADIKAIGAGVVIGGAAGAAAGSIVPGVGSIAGGVAGAVVGGLSAASGSRPTGGYASTPPASMSGLDPDFQIKLRDMIADAASQGITIGIGSGLRSTERQAQLYASDLARNGGSPSGMVAAPGHSQHERGMAADLVDASGRTIKAGSPEAAFLGANAGTYGLNRPMSYEPWHIEPVGARTGGAASVTTSDTNAQATLQAREYAAAQNLAAKATQGVGLENEKAKIAAEVAGRTDLDASEQARLATELFAAAKIRLTNEINNEKTAVREELSGARSIAEAYAQSSAEGKIQEGIVKGQTAALQKYGETSSNTAQEYVASVANQQKALEKFNETTQNAKDLLAGKDTQAQLQLQIGLTGQLPEIAQRELTLLQAKQQISKDFPFLTQQEKDNRLAMVQSTADLNVQLAEATRNQQRLDDGIRSIASTVDNTLTKSIEDAFNGTKVDDWGKRIKSMLASLVAQISDALFIKPLLGSIIGGLGFGSAASSFGSFGSLFGGSSSGSATLTPNSNGTFSINNLGSAASTLNNGSGLLGGGDGLFGSTFSGIKGFFNDIGTSLGFAPSGLAAGTGSGAGIFTDLATGATSDVLGSGVAQGLFGGTTLGGLFGGVGAGFGAGTLLNSLVGGNKLGGTLGSGAGSIAGSLIGSLLFPGVGTLLGGLLGGAGGGLFGGMFGNSKPSNASAGANFDLSQFKLTAGFAGGNSQIDQATQQVGQGIQQFLAILKTSGGALSGNVLLQNGVNTGFTVDSSLPQYSGRFNLGKDPTAALNTIELALSRSLTGISDTMQTVINQVSDPAAIEGAIAFAAAYDNLKTAADDAFKSIEDATKTTSGPFRQAIDQINALFGSLTDQANQFGLSLDPINAALAEATKRLQGDFTDSLNKAFNEATGKGFLNQLQSTYDNYIASITESQAIGLGADRSTQDLLGQVATAQLNQILGGLDQGQLDQAVAKFSGFNDVITGLAENTVVAATATTDLANAQSEAATRTAAATGRITDYLTSLKSTPSIVTSPQDALSFASTNYQALLGRAQGGDLTSLEGLTDAAGSLVQNISSFYGATQPGTQQVSQIEQDLAAVVATYGGGSNPTISAITGSTSAIQIAAASNDNWLSDIFNVTVSAGDTAKSQRDTTNSILTEIRDNLRLLLAA